MYWVMWMGITGWDQSSSCRGGKTCHVFSMIILPQPWLLWLWDEPTLWDAFVLACSLSLEKKKRNYHSGSISFPGSLNLPVWSHVTQYVTLSPCFWKRCLQRESVGLSVPPGSCIPASPPPISLWQAEKDLFSHGGREKGRDGETLGM